VTLIFYAPSISGNIFMIWQIFFHSDALGYMNSFLLKFNFIQDPIRWFRDPKYVVQLCIAVALWLSMGTAFLSFIAGLQIVDRTY